MTKTKFWLSILAISVVLIAGSLAVSPIAIADEEDDDDDDGTNVIVQKLDQIIAIITGIDTEVTNIEGKLDGTVQSFVSDIKTEPDKIQMVKGDVGMIKTTVGDIDTEVSNIEGKLDGTVQSFVSDIKTETDKIQMVKDNQYVPFTETQTSLGTCASAGASNVAETFRIAKSGESGDFIITGIIMKVGGVNPGAQLRSTQFVFGGIGYGFSTVDLISGFSGNSAVELLGAPTITGRTTPYQIALDSSITIHLLCTATANLDLDLTHVVVSGWKKPGHTISIFVT